MAITTASALPVSATPTTSRDGYIDAWRAAALLRVIVFHGISYAWLTVAFPAMGLMFALAGSLTARSLDRQAGIRVVRSRVRRLMPPLWVYAALVVPMTLLWGWGPELADPADRLDLLFWMVPLKLPAAGAYLSPAVSIHIWYLSLYLWFVLLSPVLLRVFRAWPYWTLAVAVALPVAVHLTVGFDDLPAVARHLPIYLCCWLLGFAHRDGLVRSVPGRIFAAAVGTTALVAAAGVLWEGFTHGDFNLNRYPLVYALWSAVFVAVVLRLEPAAGQARPGLLYRIIAVVNARAVTIYLWHLPCLIFAHSEIVGRLSLGDRPSRLATILFGVALTAVPVLLLGWVEDLAARRPARLLPATPQTAPDEAGPSALAATCERLRQDSWGRATAALLAALLLLTSAAAAW